MNQVITDKMKSLSRYIIPALIFFLLSITTYSQPLYSSGNTNDWELSTTWSLSQDNPNDNDGGLVPQDGDELIILSGHEVVVNNRVDIDDLELIIQENATLKFIGNSILRGQQTSIEGNGTIICARLVIPFADDFSFAQTGNIIFEVSSQETRLTSSVLRAAPFKNILFRNISDNEITINHKAQAASGDPINFVVTENISLENQGNGTLVYSIGETGGIGGGLNNLSLSLNNLTIGENCTVKATTNGDQNDKHFLNISGNVVNNGQLLLNNNPQPNYTSDSNSPVVDLTFTGDTNSTFEQNGITVLNRLIINKDGLSNKVVVNNTTADFRNFSIYGRNNNASVEKAVSLLQGELELTGNTRILSLTSGGEPFSIPENAKLTIQGENARVIFVTQSLLLNRPANEEFNMILSGTLECNQGRFDMNSDKIAYSGTTPSIDLLNGANFTIGQIYPLDPNNDLININVENQSSITLRKYNSNQVFDENNAMFSVPNPNSTLSIDNSTININGITAHADGANAIEMHISTNNVAFDNSTVNINTSGNTPFTLDVSTPLNIVNINGNGSSTLLSDFNIVLGQININDEISFNGNGNTLSLESSMLRIQNNATFDAGANADLRFYGGVGAIELLDNATATFGDLHCNNGVCVNNDISVRNLFVNTSAQVVNYNGNFLDEDNFQVSPDPLYGITLTGTSLVNNGGIYAGIILQNSEVIQVTSDNDPNLGFYNSISFASPINGNGIKYNLVGKHSILQSVSFPSKGKVDLAENANLNIRNAIPFNGAGSNAYFITTKGKLEYTFSQQGNSEDILIPIGSTDEYLPLFINSVNVVQEGSMSLKIFEEAHPVSVPNNNNKLNQFWRINTSNIQLDNINFTFNYSQNHVGGNEDTYQPYRIDSDLINHLGEDIATDKNTINFKNTDLNGDYTAGDPNAFMQRRRFFSIAGGNKKWSSPENWSLVGHDGPQANDTPSLIDIAFIAEGHTIQMDVEGTGANFLQLDGTLDLGTRNSQFDQLSGSGTLTTSQVDLPNGDLSQFFLTGTLDYFINVGGDISFLDGDIPSVVNNLSFRGNTLKRLRLRDGLTVLNNLTAETGTLSIEQSITVNNDVFANSGFFLISSNKSLTVNGSLTVNNASTLQLGTNSNLYLADNLTLDGTINMHIGNEPGAFFHFVGGQQSSITGDGVFNFSNIVVNKSNNSTRVLLENTFTGQINRDNRNFGADAWNTFTGLKFIRGEFAHQSPSTATYAVNGGVHIPKDAKFEVRNDNANVYLIQSYNNDSDVFLEGRVSVGGGNLFIGDPLENAGTDIIYGGNNSSAVISLFGNGNLFLNGQIRRENSNTNGNLSLYHRSGGALTIYGKSIDPKYGLLELIGSKSSITVTNNATILFKSGGSNLADLNINLTDLDREAGNDIYFHSESNVSVEYSNEENNAIIDEVFTIHSNIPLGNLSLSATQSPIALNSSTNVEILIESDLEVNDLSLTLNNANDLTLTNTENSDLVINGNLTVNNEASINFIDNTTYFRGDQESIIDADAGSFVSFSNLVADKENRNSIILQGQNAISVEDLTVLENNNFQCQRAIFVNGNVTHNGFSIEITPSLYVVFTSTDEKDQFIEGTGEFESIGISRLGVEGYNVIAQSDLTVFGLGVTFNQNNTSNFIIGDLQLTLLNNSHIWNGLNEERYVVTSGTKNAKGITVELSNSAGVSSYSTLGIGTFSQQLKLYLDYEYDQETPFITVKPIDGRHPSLTNTEEPSNNTLQGYWNITSSPGNYVFDRIELIAYYEEESIRGNEANYVLGMWNGEEWYKDDDNTGNLNIDENRYREGLSNLLNNDGERAFFNLSGDFTLGTSDKFGELPVYVFTPDPFTNTGDWNDANNWVDQETGQLSGQLPYKGVKVHIPETIVADVNNDVSMSAATILLGGALRLNNSTAIHDVGKIIAEEDLFIPGNILINIEDGRVPLNKAEADLSSYIDRVFFTFNTSGTFDFTDQEYIQKASFRSSIQLEDSPVVRLNNNLLVEDISIGTRNQKIILESSENAKLTIDLKDHNPYSAINGVSLFTAYRNLKDGDYTASEIGAYIKGPLVIKGTANEGESKNIPFLVGSNAGFRPLEMSVHFNRAADYQFEVEVMEGDALANNDLSSFAGGYFNDFYWRVENQSPQPGQTMKITKMSFGFDAIIDNVNKSMIAPSNRAERLPSDLVVARANDLVNGQFNLDVDQLEIEDERIDGENTILGNTLATTGNFHPEDFEGNPFALTDHEGYFIVGSMVAEEFSPLPVNLIYFEASYKQGHVTLNWATAGEVNNSHFEVQRSTDGANFETIGRVEGNGTTTVSQKYQFVDTSASSSLVYYRLKQVDYDGQYEFSPIVSVKIEGQLNDNTVSFYPNPIRSTSKVYLSSVSDLDNLNIILSDISGKTIYSNFTTLKDFNQYLAGVNNKLHSGIYLLKLQDVKGLLHQVKFVKE